MSLEDMLHLTTENVEVIILSNLSYNEQCVEKWKRLSLATTDMEIIGHVTNMWSLFGLHFSQMRLTKKDRLPWTHKQNKKLP